MLRLPEQVLKAVVRWRNTGYEGVTPTTKRLLEYWFYEDHIYEDGTPFSFWDCQREAIETLIYLYEICDYRSLYELARGFNVFITFDPREDNWAKYCFKMATGSGKTFVMAMALIWQYFNALKENNKQDYTTRVLIVSPNLIVLDRLLEGFENGGLFSGFPFFIPDEWKSEFDLQIIKQTSEVLPHSTGLLYITNVQQLYERERTEMEENPVQALLGQKPVKGEEFISRIHLKEILARYDKLVVVNDEAHHAHLETEWAKALKDIDDEKGRIILQLDFTATPWDIARNQEVPLPHIVYNYPLKRAIDDKIVKEPYLAIIEGEQRPASHDFVKRYQPEIHTAIEYLERRKKDFKDVGKKPVLFVVCKDTNSADKVAQYIQNDLGYGNKVLLIHTYVRRSKYGDIGDVRLDQLEEARKAAREIDENEYEVIVSVLMLKEGWDVRNVSIILPMRPFGSDILVEQTLGRGLRRMFPYDEDADDALYVIEHPSFRDLWDAKIKQQQLAIAVKPSREAYQESNRVYVDPQKLQYNLNIPILKGGITKIVPNISALDITSLPSSLFSLKEIEVSTPRVIEERLRDKKIVGIWELDFNFAPTIQEYLAYITKGILKKSGSASQFAQLLPKVKEYLLNYMFEEQLTEIDSETLKKLNSFVVRNKIAEIFVNALNNLGRIEKEYRFSSSYDLKDTKPFHTTSPVYLAQKTVFNCLPYPKQSRFERDFMRYLDGQREVEAYTKILRRFPIRIAYYDEEKGVRYYIPDFIVQTNQGFFLIETKGEMFDKIPSVKQKSKAGIHWCENVSKMTDKKWKFVKIRQDVFMENRGKRFSRLISLCKNF